MSTPTSQEVKEVAQKLDSVVAGCEDFTPEQLAIALDLLKACQWVLFFGKGLKWTITVATLLGAGIAAVLSAVAAVKGYK